MNRVMLGDLVTELQITQATLSGNYKYGTHHKDLQCVPFLIKGPLIRKGLGPNA